MDRHSPHRLEGNGLHLHSVPGGHRVHKSVVVRSGAHGRCVALESADLRDDPTARQHDEGCFFAEYAWRLADFRPGVHSAQPYGRLEVGCADDVHVPERDSGDQARPRGRGQLLHPDNNAGTDARRAANDTI